ncbi:MAG: FAD synthetase family protein [Bacteroidales bacterium]|nr:FAD synthetase family protein [Bacteroidales bacterium]
MALTAVTGFFDGVHAGHRLVLETLADTAARRGGGSLVVTFWPHPRVALGGGQGLKLLTSADERTALIRECIPGAAVEVLDFDRAFASLTAEEYVRDVLMGRYGVDGLVLGYDTRFGRDLPDPAAVGSICDRLGVEWCCCDVVKVGDRPVSSTLVRHALEDDGDVALAAGMLGRPYSVGGVCDGAGLFLPSDPFKVVPAPGSYLAVSGEMEVVADVGPDLSVALRPLKGQGHSLNLPRGGIEVSFLQRAGNL